MKKIFTLSILSILFSVASYALTPITPSTGSLCVGTTMALTDSLSPGGTWTSSNTAIATIGVSSGIMTGVSAGVVTITYTLSSSFVTGTYTVGVAPAPIVGGTTPICIGAFTTLTDATAGGSWSSSNPYVATVGAGTGIVSGLHGGVATINYTLPGACSVSKVVTVDAASAGVITGPSTVCVGSIIVLVDSMGLSGTWSSGSSSIAAIGSIPGMVVGVATGTTTISYTTTGPCGSSVATFTVTVVSGPSTGTLYGTTTVMAGATTNLYSTVTGGTWNSGATSIATIGTGSGLVTGVTAGTAPITYTVTGCGLTASAYTTVTVTPFDGISGQVLFGSGAYYGNVKVWLIKYDVATHSLSGYDSMVVMCSGTSVNYLFSGIPTDSFRVKAAVDSFVGTGYIPTYHNNFFYWHDANVIYHTSGTADINKDINMATGTSSTGPGFIAGDVYTGANKHTTGGIPAVGLHVCIVNSATGQLVQQTWTDATGHFTFSGLPVGVTYNVFPDSLNFITSAYTGINLTTASPSMSVASFTMHTISKTITPHTQSVKPTQSVVSSVATFPNPANDKLYVQWVEKTTESASVVITDISGREIYNNKVDFNEGAGLLSIDLSSFASGFYVITVKTETLSYNNKLQVTH